MRTDRFNATLDFIEGTMKARSAEEVWTLLVDRMNDYGFERLIYGHTRYRTENSFGDLHDILLMTTQTREYMKEFIDNEQYLHAPMIRWARENVGACSWGWVKEHLSELTDKELAVLEFNERNGVRAGYSISFPETSKRSKGAMALTAPEDMRQEQVDRIWEEYGKEILAVNQVAHLAMTSLPQSATRRSLTNRQREALQWVGDGKTTQDIALLMGLTSATVEKHLRLAREALDAETTAQAVLKASVINQIYVLEI